MWAQRDVFWSLTISLVCVGGGRWERIRNLLHQSRMTIELAFEQKRDEVRRVSTATLALNHQARCAVVFAVCRVSCILLLFVGP